MAEAKNKKSDEPTADEVKNELDKAAEEHTPDDKADDVQSQDNLPSPPEGDTDTKTDDDGEKIVTDRVDPADVEFPPSMSTLVRESVLVELASKTEDSPTGHSATLEAYKDADKE